jgi:hypothetical protein
MQTASILNSPQTQQLQERTVTRLYSVYSHHMFYTSYTHANHANRQSGHYRTFMVAFLSLNMVYILENPSHYDYINLLQIHLDHCLYIELRFGRWRARMNIWIHYMYINQSVPLDTRHKTQINTHKTYTYIYILENAGHYDYTNLRQIFDGG